MSLTTRKIIVVATIAAVFLAANILVIANWLAEHGVAEKAGWIRREFLTGTAIAVILVLLILLVNPVGRAGGLGRRCPVCDHRLIIRGGYCPEWGSSVRG
ncbi:MAG TPA: hypothetical protein ENN81_02325 [Phycisphaerales bacterium]|nr:hypothetical protein [Phycisphaerales bacterium]